MGNTTSLSAGSFQDYLSSDALAESLGFDPTVFVVLAGVVIAVATPLLSIAAKKALTVLLSKEGSPVPAASILINIARVAVWGAGICLLLSICFGIDVTGIVAALGVGGIALSLGLQDTISNLIGGVQLSTMRVIASGDHVQVNGVRGVVNDIKWRYTLIDGFSGDQFVIPNKEMFDSMLTVLPPVRKVRTALFIPYEASAAMLKQGGTIDDLTAAICDAAARRLSDPAPDGLGLKLQGSPYVEFVGSSDYAFDTNITVWIEEGEEFNYVVARDALVRAAVPYCSAGR